jgi:hypothetical protein
MIALSFAALLAMASLETASPSGVPQPQTQTQAQTQAQSDPEAVDLGEVTVEGRRLDSMIETFVNEVAAPNRRRGIARWDHSVCVGTANLRPDVAQGLIDRVSIIAEGVGLRTGEPGCAANIVVIATDQPNLLAQEMVRQNHRVLRVGGSGMDRGGAALNRFVETTAPVRWWQVSFPIDTDSGQIATRIPGECANACASAFDYAPVIVVHSVSRMSSQIVDNLVRSFVILDVNQVDKVSGQQLADYVAMVSLAQIDPDADTSGYTSILNVFDDPEATPGLAQWDLAYLEGLYDAERTRKNLRSGRMEIASSIGRAHRRLQTEEDAPQLVPVSAPQR